MQKLSEPLHGLSGTLWPIHLKPLPDELLSSWLVRLAHAHRMKVQTMCLFLFGRNRSVWARDIDKFAPDWLRDALMRVTGATAAQFEQTTLRAFEGIVTERVNVNGVGRGMVPLGVFHRTRTRAGLMWCPLCLREDSAPYFRRKWRVAYFTVCVQHRVYLEDACHVCMAPIAPHRSDMFGYSITPTATLITRCFQCRAKLTECVPKLADVRSLRLHAMFELALSQGFVNWSANPSLHSVLFFEGVRALISALTSKRSNKRLINASAFTGIDFPRKGARSTGWETEPLAVRRLIMIAAAKLLDDWPSSFMDVVRECKLRHCDLRSYGSPHPYWFDSVIRIESCRYSPPIGLSHAESIAVAVERRCGKFSSAMARQLSGHDVLPLMPYRRVQAVPHDLYEELICSLDVEIATSVVPSARAALVRDKVMFAAGRVFGLSTTRLSQFTLQECRALAPDCERPNLSSPPVTITQARAWIEWYWEQVRPALNPCTSEAFLFVSATSGRALRKSAISLRFCRAVSNANLSRPIPNYDAWKLKRSLQPR